MGGADHVVELVERMLRLGLALPGVDAHGGDVPALQGPHQGLLVVETAASDVDQPHARLHHRDLGIVDHVHGLFGARGVDGDEVGLTQQLFERGPLLDVQVGEPGVGDVGVVRDDLHGEAVGPLRHQPADAAQADDAQGLAVELAALELGAAPLAALDEAVGPGDVAAAGQDETHGVLGGRHHVALGRVADDDALLGGVGHRDVVEPRAGAADDAQVGRRVEELLVDDGLAADDDAVILGDDREQLLTGELVLDVDLAHGLEGRDAFLVHELGHKDLDTFETFQLSSITRDAQPRAIVHPVAKLGYHRVRPTVLLPGIYEWARARAPAAAALRGYARSASAGALACADPSLTLRRTPGPFRGTSLHSRALLSCRGCGGTFPSEKGRFAFAPLCRYSLLLRSNAIGRLTLVLQGTHTT